MAWQILNERGAESSGRKWVQIWTLSSGEWRFSLLSFAHRLYCLRGIPVSPFPVSTAQCSTPGVCKSRACPPASLQHPHMFYSGMLRHTHTHTREEVTAQPQAALQGTEWLSCKIIIGISVTVKNRLKEATDGSNKLLCVSGSVMGIEWNEKDERTLKKRQTMLFPAIPLGVSLSVGSSVCLKLICSCAKSH